MIIETKNLRLRKFSLEDVEDFFEITRDDDVKKYTRYAYYESIEETKEAFERYYINGDCINDFYLIIKEKASNKTIGFLIVTRSQIGLFHVTWMIAREYRGRRYAPEALKGLIKELPAGSELLFLIEKSNKNSLKSVKKIEGIFKVENNNPIVSAFGYIKA